MLLKSVPGIGGIVIWTRRPSPSHRVAAIRALHSPLPLISLSTATMILFTPGGSIRFSMPPADSAAQPGKSNNCIAEAVLSTPSPTISHSLGIGAAIRMAPPFAGPQNHGAREFPDQGVGIEQKWRNNPTHSGTKPICRCPNQPEWRVTTGLAQPQRAFQQWLPRYNGHGGGHSCSRRGHHSRWPHRASYNDVFRAPPAIGMDSRCGSAHRNAVSGAWAIAQAASASSFNFSLFTFGDCTTPTIA